MTQKLDITTAVHHRMIPFEKRSALLAGKAPPELFDRIGACLYRAVFEEARLLRSEMQMPGLVVFEHERWNYIFGSSAEEHLQRLPRRNAESLRQSMENCRHRGEFIVLHFCEETYSVITVRDGSCLGWIDYGRERTSVV